MPGLVDTHVHLVFDASLDPVKSVREATDSETVRVDAARKAVYAGSMTIRDLGDREYLSLELRDELAQQVLARPEVLAAGPPITTADGHRSSSAGRLLRMWSR